MIEAARAEELALRMPTRAQVQEQLGAMLGGYVDVVLHRAPSVFLAQAFFFIALFFWRCGGMMLLGMALLKLGFLDGRWNTRDYALTGFACVPLGLGLAAFGVSRFESVAFAAVGRPTLAEGPAT